jgi:hypothetical protein
MHLGESLTGLLQQAQPRLVTFLVNHLVSCLWVGGLTGSKYCEVHLGEGLRTACNEHKLGY